MLYLPATEIVALKMYHNQIVGLRDPCVLKIGGEIGDGTILQCYPVIVVFDYCLRVDPERQGIIMPVFVSGFGMPLL